MIGFTLNFDIDKHTECIEWILNNAKYDWHVLSNYNQKGEYLFKFDKIHYIEHMFEELKLGYTPGYPGYWRHGGRHDMKFERYYDDRKYVFENETDAALFKLVWG